MTKQLLINLPVADLEAAKALYTSLGLAVNDDLSDKNATCLNLEDNIIIALLPIAHFKETIYGNAVAEVGVNETQFAIGVDSKEKVDSLLDKAVAAGGQEAQDRVDLPQIYAGTFKDLDGHLWNVFHMR